MESLCWLCETPISSVRICSRMYCCNCRHLPCLYAHQKCVKNINFDCSECGGTMGKDVLVPISEGKGVPLPPLPFPPFSAPGSRNEFISSPKFSEGGKLHKEEPFPWTETLKGVLTSVVSFPTSVYKAWTNYHTNLSENLRQDERETHYPPLLEGPF
jgi:hypothetical protein